jgi:hypothetical protein
MKRPSPVYLTIRNERERAEFFEIGIDLPKGKMTPGGEFVRFDIAEDDPRFESFSRILVKRETGQRFPVGAEPKLSQHQPDWLEGYSGQTVEQLLSLEGRYRIDSLVLAFEQAIQEKRQRGEKGLTDAERVVLAAEALEREVNNGGYDQFFVNSSDFAQDIVESLRCIGCKKTATITKRAIKALGVSQPTREEVNAAMAAENERRSAKLTRCDDAYYEAAEPLADRLFAFIKANRPSINF